jgi:hypothetical protein
MKKLPGISDSDPFRVPENYFEEVNNRIISATSGSREEIAKRGFFERWKTYIMAAASVTAFVILAYSAVLISVRYKSGSQQTAVTSNENTEQYLDDIDILTLEESASSEGFSVQSSDLNKSEIIEYLLLDNIDVDDIYEQL